MVEGVQQGPVLVGTFFRREAATPSPSGTMPEMATAHVRVRSAARATLVACLQGPPPDASEGVLPQAFGIQ